MKKSLTLAFCISLVFIFIASTCTPKLTGVEDDPNAIAYDKTRILVLLADNATPEKLILSYEKYGLEKIGPASRTFNEWLFKWSAKINPDVLLEDIKGSPIVKKAEFPQKFQENN